MNRFVNGTKARRTGLTILELLLALAGTGFVAVAIVMMLSAVTAGTDTRTDLRQSVVRQKLIAARLTAAIRSSQMVLVAEDDLLVLWRNDADGSQTPDLAEIQRIERDPATGELRSYAAPLDLASASNTPYTLTTDFDAVTQALRESESFPKEVWATGLRSWSIALNEDTVQDASLVSCRLVIRSGDVDEVVIAAAALRNSGTTSFAFLHPRGSFDITFAKLVVKDDNRLSVSFHGEPMLPGNSG